MKLHTYFFTGILLFTGFLSFTQDNTIYGSGAGTQGKRNSFFGYNSGKTTTGVRNVFIGYETAIKNTKGAYNVMIGDRAGYANKTGYRNTFLGTLSGYKNETGSFNTATGAYSGFQNTTGGNNISFGYEAGLKNTPGSYNTFIGISAGAGIWSSGNYNIFLGNQAGYKISTGHYNIFLGQKAGYNISTGHNNIFLGQNAGLSHTSGSHNTIIGQNAGYRSVSGTGNVFLGRQAGYNELGSNKLYIDNSTTTTPLLYGDFSKKELTVNGNLEVSGGISPNFILSDENNKKIQFGVAGNIGSYNKFAKPGDVVGRVLGGGDLIFSIPGLNGTRKIGFHTESDKVLTIQEVGTTGKVGVGTTAFPTTVGGADINAYRLFVKGGILTEEIRVRTDWADYVFDMNYNLKSLEEVELYIQNNGYLPGMPSALTIKNDGLELGDITRLQQEKIEELTLYTIAQEKKITAQQKAINQLESLKKRFDQLEKLIKDK